MYRKRSSLARKEYDRHRHRSRSPSRRRSSNSYYWNDDRDRRRRRSSNRYWNDDRSRRRRRSSNNYWNDDLGHYVSDITSEDEFEKEDLHRKLLKKRSSRYSRDRKTQCATVTSTSSGIEIIWPMKTSSPETTSKVQHESRATASVKTYGDYKNNGLRSSAGKDSDLHDPVMKKAKPSSSDTASVVKDTRSKWDIRWEQLMAETEGRKKYRDLPEIIRFNYHCTNCETPYIVAIRFPFHYWCVFCTLVRLLLKD